jgi:hypothetical protein
MEVRSQDKLLRFQVGHSPVSSMWQADQNYLYYGPSNHLTLSSFYYLESIIIPPWKLETIPQQKESPRLVLYDRLVMIQQATSISRIDDKARQCMIHFGLPLRWPPCHRRILPYFNLSRPSSALLHWNNWKV